MERDIAERIVRGIMDLSAPLNALDRLSEQIADPEEARAFRLALGELMSGTFAVLRPIIKQFPELDPDREAAS